MPSPLPLPCPKALPHLRKVDPTMERVIDQVGLVTAATLDGPIDLFQSLFRSILYQQLHGKAAAAIHGRVRLVLEAAAPKSQAQALLDLPDEPLRQAGLSANKLRALRDLAAKSLTGTVPTTTQAVTLTDDALISQLTQVRGIGPWTVHMVLIFTLGRPDVLPLEDFSVAKAIQQLYGKGRDLKKPDMAKIAEPWRPYRSTAILYLYRYLSLEEKKETLTITRPATGKPSRPKKKGSTAVT